jgi:[ribosomal protein S5]-alanine N-acetyltransferase
VSCEPIVTARLVLRPLGAESARAIADGDYSGVNAGRGWPTETTSLVARLSVIDPGALTWLITHEDLVIGECGLKHAPDTDGTAEIGYGLGTGWRSKGYGIEAVDGLMDRLRATAVCRRLTAHVHETNIPSRRLLDRLGFTLDRPEPPFLWYARALV